LDDRFSREDLNSAARRHTRDLDEMTSFLTG
jgi:hypothetical protein